MQDEIACSHVRNKFSDVDEAEFPIGFDDDQVSQPHRDL